LHTSGQPVDAIDKFNVSPLDRNANVAVRHHRETTFVIILCIQFATSVAFSIRLK
jgi:hypothetical protein